MLCDRTVTSRWCYVFSFLLFHELMVLLLSNVTGSVQRDRWRMVVKASLDRKITSDMKHM